MWAGVAIAALLTVGAAVVVAVGYLSQRPAYKGRHRAVGLSTVEQVRAFSASYWSNWVWFHPETHPVHTCERPPAGLATVTRLDAARRRKERRERLARAGLWPSGAYPRIEVAA